MVLLGLVGCLNPFIEGGPEPTVVEQPTVAPSVRPEMSVHPELAWSPPRVDLDAARAAVIEPGESAVALAHIAVTGHVDGSIADIEVAQTFVNSFDHRIEAVYIFPLPEGAAIREMDMVIGERVIRADLREREAAREAYEEARDRGHVASLLEQERPNIFTMNVANIEPGHAIQVRTRYVEQLDYRDGAYHFDFPTVVGPRFIPGTPAGHEGDGLADDTDAVPDASRITPPVVPEGTRVPYEVELELTVDAGMAIYDLVSTSHDLDIDWESERRAVLRLPEAERHPDRDIVFNFSLADDEPVAGFLTHWDERGGFFTLMLEPPVSFEQDDVRPRELVFVVDNSGSMGGIPINTAKETMRYALRHLNPDDTFQILRFSDAATTMAPRPLTNTAENIATGMAFIDAMQGGGGTHMTAGIRAALEPPIEAGRLRTVLFLTDGYIGNEGAIFVLIDELLGESRLFSLGVGSSVNRYLLDQMADIGRGDVFYMNADEPPEVAVEGFYARINNPILTDIAVDWGDLSIHSVTPQPIRDVFEGTPLLLTGRYSSGDSGTIVISGLRGLDDLEIRVDVDLPEVSDDGDAIASIWARRQVDGITAQVYGEPSEAVRDEVLELALEFDLMTQYTSFVAIDESSVVGTSDPLHSTVIPVALPAGVPQTAVGYGSSGYGGGGSSGRGSGGASGSFRRSVSAHPRVLRGGAQMSGDLDRESIQRVIRRHHRGLRLCYERQLESDPSLSGRLVVFATIAENGEVISTEIRENALNEDVAACVIAEFERMIFEGQSGGQVTFSYPFVFRPPD
jgi:Ca-activated chloride channel family protein